MTDSVGYKDAKQMIRRILADGRWHRSTKDIHEPLYAKGVRGWMFGKAKKELGIEHRWNGPKGVGSRGPDSYVEWHLKP